jgi:hypothetical protein
VTDSDSQINVNSQFTDTPTSRLVTATEGVESVHTTGTPNVVPQTTKSASVGVGGSGEASGEAEGDSSSKYVPYPSSSSSSSSSLISRRAKEADR